MVRHDQVSVLRRSAAVPVETLLRLVVFAMRGQTVIRCRGCAQPEQLLEAVELDLRAVAIVGLRQPDQHPQLELHLIVEPRAIRAPAGRVEISIPAPQTHVIGPALQQGGLEIEGQPAAHERDVLCEQLLLQRDGVRRDHHPLTRGHRMMDRRHQVGERFPRAWTGLDEQATASRVELGNRERHLQLGLTQLVIVEAAGHRTVRTEQRTDGLGIGRRRRAPRRCDGRHGCG